MAKAVRPQPPLNRRRDKPQLSCTPCRRKKRKCDRKSPCGRCDRLGDFDSCIYATVQSEGAAQRDTVRQYSNTSYQGPMGAELNTGDPEVPSSNSLLSAEYMRSIPVPSPQSKIGDPGVIRPTAHLMTHDSWRSLRKSDSESFLPTTNNAISKADSARDAEPANDTSSGSRSTGIYHSIFKFPL